MNLLNRFTYDCQNIKDNNREQYPFKDTFQDVAFFGGLEDQVNPPSDSHIRDIKYFKNSNNSRIQADSNLQANSFTFWRLGLTFADYSVKIYVNV